MIPLELAMTDFRSYRGPEIIDFRGLRRACIIGPNGAGKSTIITAMLWALYGKSQVPKNADLVRRGADSGSVKLIFEADGETYRIEREVKSSGSTKAWLYHVDGGEELITEGVRNVSGWIDNNLRLNYDTTINASVILQGKADRFSTMTPAERNQFLSEVLGLSICEKIASLARSKARDREARADMKSAEIERLDEQLAGLSGAEKQLEVAKNELLAAEKAEKSANEALAQIREHKNKIESVIGEIRLLEERKNAAQQDITEIKGSIEEAKKRQQKLQELLERTDEIEQGWEKLQNLREEREKLNLAKSRRLELQGEISRIQTEIERRRKAIELEIERLSEARKGIAGQMADIDKLLAKEETIHRRYAELLDARKALESLNESREAARALSKKIDALKADIDRQQAKIETTLSEKRKVLAHLKVEDIAQLEKRLYEFESRLKYLPVVREKRDTLKEQGTTANARIKALDNEREQIKDAVADDQEKIALLKKSESSRCPLCGQSLDAEHRGKVVSDIQNEITTKRARIDEIAKEIQTLKDKINKLREQWKTISAEIEELEEVTEKRAELKARLKAAKTAKTEYAELEKNIYTLEKQLANEDFAGQLRSEVAQLREKLAEKKIPDDLFESAQKRVEKLADSEFQVKQLSEEKEKMITLQNRMKETEGKIEGLKKKLEKGEEIADKNASLNNLRKELDSIVFDHDKLNRTEAEIKVFEKFEEQYHALKAARKDNKELADRIKAQEKKLSEIGEKASRFRSEIEQKREGLPSIEKLQDDLQKAEKAYREASERHREAAVEFSQAKARVEEYEKLNRQKSEAKSDKADFESEARLHRLIGEAMGKSGVPAFVITNALPEIEREADRLLSLLTGDEMSLRLTSSRDDDQSDKLEVHISTPTGESGYENFSGGEAFRLDFALRVALSRFLARGGGGISTLIIDEGFGTQDNEGLALLAEALRAIEDEFDMILTITHLERFKEEFDQVIEVTKLPGKGSIAKVFS